MIPLVEKLLEIQKKKGFSDAKMSKKLCVCRQRWQQIRSEPEKALGTISPLHTGILTNFPELEDDLISFIKSGKVMDEAQSN
jgi:hypothetical protein